MSCLCSVWFYNVGIYKQADKNIDYQHIPKNVVRDSLLLYGATFFKFAYKVLSMWCIDFLI
jgi:hypothetical protein